MFISFETFITYFITFIADVIKIQAPFTDFNSTTAPTTETTPPQTPAPNKKDALGFVSQFVLGQLVYFGFAPEYYLVFLCSTGLTKEFLYVTCLANVEIVYDVGEYF